MPQTQKEKFESLLREIRGCTLCSAHLPCGPKPVFVARQKARILVAGQAPGKRVHETGITFNDPSGERLRAWMGIDRDIFYNHPAIAIIPMGFCYPGTGKDGDMPPRPECAPAWRDKLMQHMPDIALTVLAGQYAHNWHLGKRKKRTLTETARAWREYWPEIMPLPHPSPRNTLLLKKNPWIENEMIPALQKRIAALL